MNLDNLIIDGDFATIILWFVIYCMIGWLWESAYRTVCEKKFINSGFLTGPVIPIYGFGAMLYIVLLHFTNRPIELFFLGGILACTLEYITSWALEKIFHARWWQYDNAILNINGRICLAGFVAFGAFAVILPYVHLFIGSLTAQLPNIVRIILAIVSILIILADTATTVKSLVKFNKVLRRYQKILTKKTSGIVEFIRKGGNYITMHFKRGEHKDRKVFTFQQRRILQAFRNFRSTEYPDAFKHLVKIYEETDKQMKESQYKPRKPRTKKK